MNKLRNESSREPLAQPQWMEIPADPADPAATSSDQPATLNEWLTEQTLAKLAEMAEADLLEFSRRYAATDSHWTVTAMNRAMEELDEVANVQDLGMIYSKIRQVMLGLASAMVAWHLRDDDSIPF